MSTIKTTTLSTQGGSTVPVDTVVNGTAKAWVHFDGTGTVAIRRAFNVSSLTDNGTGDYTVNFTTAMPDANYSAAVGWNVFSSTNIRSAGFNDYLTTSIDVYGGYMGPSSAFIGEDRSLISVTIFS
jgi:hypothetical protein